MQIKIPPGFETIDPKLLKHHPKNVKKHSKKQIEGIAEAIKLLGVFKDPLVIDKKNLVWIGNGRLDAALLLEMPKVPWIPLDHLTMKQRKALMIIDNKLNESEWNKENMMEILGEIQDYNFEIFNIDLEEFKPPPEIIEDEAPTKRKTTKIKLGDIFKLGDHVVMCGDALNHKSRSKILKNKKIHLLFTDPPYGLGGYAGRSGKFQKMKGDNEEVEKFYEVLDKSIPERYIWGGWSNVKNFDEVPRDVIIWKKNNFGMGKGYRGQYELCMYFGKFSGSDSDVWEEKKDSVIKYTHPTQKPVALASRAILNSTKERDLVLDLYLGSGSTLIACQQTNRICIGMEIDPLYVQVIVDRWENFTGKKAEKL